jgi:hypothetical protein
MRESLVRWATEPAPWWAFWRPGSGIVGGMIAGIVLLCIPVWLEWGWLW